MVSCQGAIINCYGIYNVGYSQWKQADENSDLGLCYFGEHSCHVPATFHIWFWKAPAQFQNMCEFGTFLSRSSHIPKYVWIWNVPATIVATFQNIGPCEFGTFLPRSNHIPKYRPNAIKSQDFSIAENVHVWVLLQSQLRFGGSLISLWAHPR